MKVSDCVGRHEDNNYVEQICKKGYVYLIIHQAFLKVFNDGTF